MSDFGPVQFDFTLPSIELTSGSYVFYVSGDKGLNGFHTRAVPGVFDNSYRFGNAVVGGFSSTPGTETSYDAAFVGTFAATPATGVVPEPSSIILIASGLAAVGVFARRRRR